MQHYIDGKSKIFILLLCGLFLSCQSFAAAKTLLYVPLDNRPVCLKYSVDAIESSGYKTITPPLSLISSRYQSGDPELLWQWLLKNAKSADAAVIAVDSLVYGGLVPSRTHHLPSETIAARINRLKELKTSYPQLKLYCFSTLLRTPIESAGGVEPPYYEEYGANLFRIGELMDKMEIYGYNYLDQTEVNNLTELTPPEYYKDWLERRQKNLTGHFQLAGLSRERYFHYYAIGKDDNAPLSQTHRETRVLLAKTADISSARLQIVPGVDQLGLLLLVRAINESNWRQPYIYPIYATGTGAHTIPLYSDQTVGESVNTQILAANGLPSSNIDKAELFLFVNTPPNGVTKEAIHPENLYFASKENKLMALELKNILTLGRPVALADVSYANGADNGFMHELYQNGLIPRLSAYAGWNTADNSIGYAIATGLLSPRLTPEKRRQALNTRLVDDWYYQANVRSILKNNFGKINQYDLGKQKTATVKALYKELQLLGAKYPKLGVTVTAADFPWNRLFEVYVETKAVGK